ncbi:MAG: hypothetical protein K1Y01_02915 [Vicinamibacteria bacterium]|nr:hypothetical protein [Vicinamibacteria bacterium]
MTNRLDVTPEVVLARFGAHPAPESRPAVRALLDELTASESGCQGDASTEAMRLCCIHLFAAGEPADGLVVGRAKTAGMDADASIDVQLLCGAGVEATRAFLRAEASGEAPAAPRREALACFLPEAP